MGKMRFNRSFLLVLADIGLVNLAIHASLLLRFDAHVPHRFVENYQTAWIPLTVVGILSLWVNGLYRGIWRYAGLRTLLAVTRAVTIASSAMIIWSLVIPGPLFPRTAMILIWMLQITFLGLDERHQPTRLNYLILPGRVR